MAKQVPEGCQSGWRIMRRMMKDEVSWVQYWKIALCKQGQHEKVACMLDEDGVLLAVQEYISTKAGQSKFLLVAETFE